MLALRNAGVPGNAYCWEVEAATEYLYVAAHEISM